MTEHTHDWQPSESTMRHCSVCGVAELVWLARQERAEAEQVKARIQNEISTALDLLVPRCQGEHQWIALNPVRVCTQCNFFEIVETAP